MMHLKLLKKIRASQSKRHRWKETTKIRAEINELENKRKIGQINETN
jgi:hypothetical protein